MCVDILFVQQEIIGRHASLLDTMAKGHPLITPGIVDYIITVEGDLAFHSPLLDHSQMTGLISRWRTTSRIVFKSTVEMLPAINSCSKKIFCVQLITYPYREPVFLWFCSIRVRCSHDNPSDGNSSINFFHRKLNTFGLCGESALGIVWGGKDYTCRFREISQLFLDSKIPIILSRFDLYWNDIKQINNIRFGLGYLIHMSVKYLKLNLKKN